VIGFYIFDVFVLPIRTVEVLLDWYYPNFATYPLHRFIPFVTDIVSYGLGIFVAITYSSNYSSILHLFITDSIGKLK